jgi:hypothetical protein
MRKPEIINQRGEIVNPGERTIASFSYASLKGTAQQRDLKRQPKLNEKLSV